MPKKRIAILEDDFIIQMFLEKIFEREGCNVVGVCSTSEEIFDLVSKEKIDLLFVDVGIGEELTGVDVMERITKTHNIPFVYLTGNSDKYTRLELEQTGALDIIFKPIDQVDFVAKLNEIFDKLDN